VQLPQAEKSMFFRLLGPGTNEKAARTEFEAGVHHWVFVHELGHWWQACKDVVDHGHHYAIEYGADVIATAFWRSHDPAIISHQRRVFEKLLNHTPNPVPHGHRAEAYFDENFEALGPTPAYIWFQARMCLAATRIP
jgi:hypothetical protein